MFRSEHLTPYEIFIKAYLSFAKIHYDAAEYSTEVKKLNLSPSQIKRCTPEFSPASTELGKALEWRISARDLLFASDDHLGLIKECLDDGSASSTPEILGTGVTGEVRVLKQIPTIAEKKIAGLQDADSYEDAHTFKKVIREFVCYVLAHPENLGREDLYCAIELRNENPTARIRMEHYTGERLSEWIKGSHEGRSTEETLKTYAFALLHLAMSLKQISLKRFVHQDIQFNNIVGTEEKWNLIDFGSAYFLDEGPGELGKIDLEQFKLEASANLDILKEKLTIFSEKDKTTMAQLESIIDKIDSVDVGKTIVNLRKIAINPHEANLYGKKSNPWANATVIPWSGAGLHRF